MAEAFAWLRRRLANRPDSEHGQALVRIVLILLILAGLVIHLIRKRQRRMLIAALPLVLLSGVVFLAVTLPMVRDLPAYAYLLLILVIIWILEGIRTAIRWHSIRST